mmetsp:Transcript_37079/g.54555  ORF Transcript_37079/g.54555 Transcript_37079/m.54555 type:complete len:390 (+) Transcript_37079:249-1418(+)
MTAYSALTLAALMTLSSFCVAAAFSNEFASLPSRQMMLGDNGGGTCYGHGAPNTRTAAIAISSTTALFYKDLEGTETSDETQQQQQQEEIFVRSKKRNNKQLFKKSRASSYTTAAAIKKNKKNKLKNKQRSYTLHKRSKGVPVATREELATHVQSVFSDLKEYELGATADGDIEDQLNNNNNSHDTVNTHDKGIMKQNSLLLDKHPSLVLNADYQPLRMLPLSTWSWQNTVKAVLSGKAVVVDVYPDLYVRAVSLDIPVPSVIALREYAPTGKAKPAFTRRNVFLRDGYRCQYCSHLFRTTDLSLDHVMPRCLGGKLTWDNTVTCCKKCNGRKGSLLPTQLDVVGMELKREPRRPSLYELAAEAGRFVPRRVHPTWEPFLGGGNREKED